MPWRGLLIVLFACGLLLAGEAAAGELPDFKKIEIKGLTHTAIGVTRRDTPIAAYVCPEDTNYSTKKCRILLIGGLDGERKSVDAVLDVLKWFQTHEDAREYHRTLALSAIPCGNPDGLMLDNGSENGSGGKPGEGYPPLEPYYQSRKNVESQYLWRWIANHAPTGVIDVRADGQKSWGIAKELDWPWVRGFANEHRLQPQVDLSDEKSSLVYALSTGAARPVPASDNNSIVLPAAPSTSACRVQLGGQPGVEALRAFLSRQSAGMWAKSSPNRNSDDSKLVVDQVLNRHLGSVSSRPTPRGEDYFDTLMYVALLRQDRNVKQSNKPLFDGIRQGRALPGVLNWAEQAKTQKVSSGSQLAGRMLYLSVLKWKSFIREAERFETTLRDIGDLSLDREGHPLPQPLFNNEMSDAVFMNGPILAGVGKLTGESKYYDACAQHVNFTLKLCKRDDGLYRHSPLCEAAWGRGNGFVAMGLALVLEDLPKDHPERAGLLKAYQEHLATLKQHQDYTGCWHQVIDHPESYREFTCTCMIGFAMASGIRHGWLEKKEFQPCVDKAWDAARVRVIGDKFMDVCTGTGKQKTLRDYLDREALFTADARAASMFLMFASER